MSSTVVFTSRFAMLFSSMSLVKRQKVSEDLAVKKTNGGSILYNNGVILEGHAGPVYSAQFNQEFIVSGGDDKAINIWKIPTEEDSHLGTIRGHKAAVTSVCWMNDSIVSGSADSSVAVWDCETGQKLRNWKNGSIINQVVFSGSILASCDDAGTVKIWDSRQKNPVNSIQTKYPVLTIALNQVGNLYFSGIDPHINAYDLRDTTTPLWRESSTIDSITSLAINHDDSMLVSRSTRGAVSTYNAKQVVPENVSRSSPYIYDGAPSGNEFKLIRTCFSFDNSRIISGSDDKTVTIWDVMSRRIMGKFEGHEAPVLDVDSHPKEKLVLSTSLDGTIIVREY